MDDGAKIDGGEAQLDEPEQVAMLPAIKRGRGRPKGRDYRDIDRPRHEEMRHLLEQGLAPSISLAAKMVAHRAYPPNSKPESKQKRLATSYPWPHPEPRD